MRYCWSRQTTNNPAPKGHNLWRLRRALLGQRVNAAVDAALHEFRADVLQWIGAGSDLPGGSGSEASNQRFTQTAIYPTRILVLLPMTLLVLALIVTGGRRLRHLRYLQGDLGGSLDSAVLRTCRVTAAWRVGSPNSTRFMWMRC